MSGYDEVVEFLMAWMTFLVAVLPSGAMARCSAPTPFHPSCPFAVNRVLRVVILGRDAGVRAVIYTAYGYKFAAECDGGDGLALRAPKSPGTSPCR